MSRIVLPACPKCSSPMDEIERNYSDRDNLQFYICRDCTVLAELRNGNMEYATQRDMVIGWSQWRWNAREEATGKAGGQGDRGAPDSDAAEGSPAAD